VRASKTPKAGTLILLGGGERVEVAGRDGDLFHLHSLDTGDTGFADLMVRYGHVPLPPYIRRPDEASDLERYQTVYGRHEGAVAAPTAGLHFDASMLARVAGQDVRIIYLTLHVGVGTFQPVRVERLEEHVMHCEWLEAGGL